MHLIKIWGFQLRMIRRANRFARIALRIARASKGCHVFLWSREVRAQKVYGLSFGPRQYLFVPAKGLPLLS